MDAARIRRFALDEDYQESGSNITINIISGRRFKSTQVIQPVLDNDVSGTHFPAVDELMEKADNPADGKLYLRCEAEVMEPIVHNHDQQDFESFVGYISPLSNLIMVAACIVAADGLRGQCFICAIRRSRSFSSGRSRPHYAAQLTYNSKCSHLDNYRTHAGLHRGRQRYNPGHFRG